MRYKRVSLILFLMISTLLSGMAPQTRTASTAVITELNPPPIVSPVSSGPALDQKVAKLTYGDFEPTVPHKAPLKTVPFTADELRNVGGNRIVPCPNGGICVLVFRHSTNPAVKIVPQPVPIEQYAAQLTLYEKFLNGLGYSLRTSAHDLGPIMRLRRKKPTPPTSNEQATKKVIFDPTIRERSGEMRINREAVEPPLAVSQQVERAGQRTTMVPLPRRGIGSSPVGYCECLACAPEQKSLNGDVILNAVDRNGNPVNAGGPGGSIKVSAGNSCGDVSAKHSCPLASCLYDGALSGHWSGISFCYPQTQGNDWFGTNFCAEMSSSECGSKGNLNVRNSESAHQVLTIFGITIPVLEGDVTAAYENGVEVPDHHLAFFGQEMQSLSLDENIPGPGAIIPVGPVPFTVTTKLEIKLSVGKPHFNFTDPSPSACNQNGLVGVATGIDFYSSISLDAGIDLLVVKAGVEGQLVLANDSFGIGIDSDIRPAADEVRVTPNLQYRLQHLYGSLSLYAEVDLLVTSKRFEIPLVELDSGFGTKGVTIKEPIATKTFKAVKTGLSL
jgi:hypothetical protein